MKEINIGDDNEILVQVINDLIDVCTLSVCFDVHRSLRLGYWDLLETDHESQSNYEIVNQPGVDVFGQQPVKKQQDCVCPNCSRTLAANRFAPHLEKCMGMGRNSSRIASKRLRGQGPVDGEYNDDNDVDYDWFEYAEKKSRKKKDKDKLTNSPKRSKTKKGDSGIGLSGLVTNGGNSRPGTPCSTGSGEISNIKAGGPTLQALEDLSQEEKIALLTQTCGAISEHTGKMCTRTGKCVQHTDEQRKNVRELLLGDIDEVPWPPNMRGEGISQLSSSLDQDDIHVDVDGYEDIDSGSLLRELTPLSWEQESNVSTGSESMSGPPPNLTSSPSIQKTKKSKSRKNKSR